MTPHPPAGITTPALVVDEGILDRNVVRMAEEARADGVALRPHAKTHKTTQIARRQLHSGARGLTVATIGEAETFAADGADDLFIAYPLWPDNGKAQRLRRLANSVTLTVGVDSVAGATHLGRSVRDATGAVEALVEVDSGHHRSGTRPEDAAEVARAAVTSGLRVRGAFTFPGHGYDPRARQSAAREEEQALRAAARVLEAAGVRVDVLSGGSTPTVAARNPGVPTELRPGVYVFNDATQVALGTCAVGDVALGAAATVVSVPEADRCVLDAGSKTIGADRQPWQDGHGLLPAFPGASITSLTEHHAVVRLADAAAPPAPGSVVTVLPNHVCTAVNLVDELVVVRAGAEVDRWRVAARGANS